MEILEQTNRLTEGEGGWMIVTLTEWLCCVNTRDGEPRITDSYVPCFHQRIMWPVPVDKLLVTLRECDVMFSVVSVRHYVYRKGSHATITHDALTLTIQGPPDMGRYCTGTP